MLRAFVAVNISEQQRDEVGRVLANLSSYDVRVRWVKIGNVHVTLKFLGDTSEKVLPDLYHAIGECLADQHAFDLSLAKLGCFPNARYPRIIWIGIDSGYEALKGMSRRIEGAVEPFGFKREKRKFSAHLTIGRVRDNKNISSLIEDISNWDFASSVAKISKVVFYQSTLRQQGPIYTSLREFELIP
jgi:2'-5' RNA ligase